MHESDRRREWAFRPIQERARWHCDRCGKNFEAYHPPGTPPPPEPVCCGEPTTTIEEE